MSARLLAVNLSLAHDAALAATGAVQINGYSSLNEDSVRVTFSADLNPVGFAAVDNVLDLLKQGAEFLIVADSDLIRAVIERTSHDASSPVSVPGGRASDIATVEDHAPGSAVAPSAGSGALSGGAA